MSEAITWNVEPSVPAYELGHKQGYAEGFAAAESILEFAQNVNALMSALIDSPFAGMLVQGNPGAKAALKALKDK